MKDIFFITYYASFLQWPITVSARNIYVRDLTENRQAGYTFKILRKVNSGIRYRSDNNNNKCNDYSDNKTDRCIENSPRWGFFGRNLRPVNNLDSAGFCDSDNLLRSNWDEWFSNLAWKLRIGTCDRKLKKLSVGYNGNIDHFGKLFSW